MSGLSAVQDREVVHLRGRIDPRLYEAILSLIQIRDSVRHATLLPNEANEVLRFITLYYGGHDAAVSSGGASGRTGLQAGEGLPRDSDCAAGVVGDLGHHLPLASAASTGLEVVPLEALRLGPSEVLILRLPSSWTPDRIDEISATLKSLGLDGRVLIVADEIEIAVVEDEDAAS